MVIMLSSPNKLYWLWEAKRANEAARDFLQFSEDTEDAGWKEVCLKQAEINTKAAKRFTSNAERHAKECMAELLSVLRGEDGCEECKK